MTLIYVFSETDLDKALRAYVKQAIDAYPDRAELIHIVDDAMRDFMRSEFAEKFVTGESAADTPGFGRPMPEPPLIPDPIVSPQAELPLAVKGASANPQSASPATRSHAILSWDDDD